MPKKLSQEIEKAYQIANGANFSEEELEFQHRKKTGYTSKKVLKNLASKEGRKEGRLEEKNKW